MKNIISILFIILFQCYASIGRINISNTNISLSSIALGALHFPEYTNVDLLINHLDTAINLNITTLDTADVYGWYKDGYGKSNDLISNAFNKRLDLRNKFEIVAKFGIRLNGGYHVDLSPEWIEESLERYLELFNTSYVDVFMIHNPSSNIDNYAVAYTFKQMYIKNKVKAFGVSNFFISDYEALQVAMMSFGIKISVYEVETSVLHPKRIFDNTVEYMSKNNLTILGWGPLGGDPNGGKNLLFNNPGSRETRIINSLKTIGNKIDKYPDKIAIAWLLNQEYNIIPILGTTKQDRLKNQSVDSILKLQNSDIQYISSNLFY